MTQFVFKSHPNPCVLWSRSFSFSLNWNRCVKVGRGFSFCRSYSDCIWKPSKTALGHVCSWGRSESIRCVVTINFFLEPALEVRISRYLEKTSQQDVFWTLGAENKWHDLSETGATALHGLQISQLLIFENLEDYSIKFTLACQLG